MKTPNTKTESRYAKSQRRRAEKIIAATGCYSAAFRNEVQQALDKLPHKLPLLFREADRINERLASAGRSVRAAHRKAGIPLGEPSPRPAGRSPKNRTDRQAEEIESVFVQYQNDDLNEEMSERANLISDILYETANEVHVSSTHPQILKAYYIAIQEAELDSRRDCERTQVALNQIYDLMNGCSEARYEEIDTYWNGETEEAYAARARALGEVYEPHIVERGPTVENSELDAKRTQLANLERVPENEAIRFQIESEIYQFDHESNIDEWPDVIG